MLLGTSGVLGLGGASYATQVNHCWRKDRRDHAPTMTSSEVVDAGALCIMSANRQMVDKVTMRSAISLTTT